MSGDGWTVKDTPLAYDYPDYRRAIEARTADGSPAARRSTRPHCGPRWTERPG